MEKAERNDPTEPIERAEPIEPIDMKDPRLPIDRTEFSDHSDHRERAVLEAMPHSRRWMEAAPCRESPVAGQGVAPLRNWTAPAQMSGTMSEEASGQ